MKLSLKAVGILFTILPPLVAITATADPTLPFQDSAGCSEGALAQFGQYVGDWKIEDSSLNKESGEWEVGKGARWIFSCLGNGTAIQDFWMPTGGPVGTNLRTYHPETESWDIAWAIKGLPGFAHIIAEQSHEGQIVMKYKSPLPDPPRRITFFPVIEDSWHWKLELSFDAEETWVEVYRIEASPYVCGK